MPPVPQHVPVRLTQAQRKVVAEIVPDLANRLKLDEPPQRTTQSTLDEIKAIRDVAEAARIYARQARLGLEAQNDAAENATHQ